MRSKQLLAIAAGVLFGMFGASSAQAKYFFNFQNPVTPIAHEFLFIHDLFLAIIPVIFLLAFGVLLYSIVFHRKSRNPSPPSFTGPTTRKAWILSSIPIVILILIDYVVLGIPSFDSILALANTGGEKLLVVATASQWQWHYAYPAYGIEFTSTLSTPADEIYGNAKKDKHFLLEVHRPLVLPTDEKVVIALKSEDVIHGFWVPAFGVKTDAIPGFVRKTWVNIEKPGVYRGQCSELCGVGHAFMPIVVDAKSKAAFLQWVALERAQEKAAKQKAGKAWTRAALMDNGKRVFAQNCAVCHQTNGLGVAGTFPPIAAGHPFSASAELISKLQKRGFYKDGRIVEGPLADHIGIVLEGIANTAMPAFSSRLDDAAIASVITFERNSFGNHTGEIVQPSKVKAERLAKKK